MAAPSVLRYIAPNLVTSLAMLFGLIAMVSATRGEYVFASWLIVWATFLDRADGVVARLLKATSEFGVQMDSFADFFNFGVAPAFITFTALTTTPGLPTAEGGGRILAIAASALWIFACTFRLARFNVIADEPRYKGLFFGIPTTLAVGALATWFLTLLKYAGADNPLSGRDQFSEGRAFGDLALGPEAWLILPIGMLFGAFLMVSNLRMRKPGLSFKRPGPIAFSLLAISGVTFGFLRIFPELMVLMPTVFILVWIALQPAQSLRSIPAPPFIPVSKTGS